jgi:hypothetical protein
LSDSFLSAKSGSGNTNSVNESPLACFSSLPPTLRLKPGWAGATFLNLFSGTRISQKYLLPRFHHLPKTTHLSRLILSQLLKGLIIIEAGLFLLVKSIRPRYFATKSILNPKNSENCCLILYASFNFCKLAFRYSK